MGATDRWCAVTTGIGCWPPGSTVNHNLLDQYVARIRRKLVGLANAPRLVTVHGVGYRLLPDRQ
jgi:DNA-binding response OmpR family regulator